MICAWPLPTTTAGKEDGDDLSSENDQEYQTSSHRQCHATSQERRRRGVSCTELPTYKPLMHACLKNVKIIAWYFVETKTLPA